jgi:hypothetical protein
MSRYCQDRASGILYNCRYCTPEGGFCEMPPDGRCWLLDLVRHRDALLRAAREVLRVDGPVAQDDPVLVRTAVRHPALAAAVQSSSRTLRMLQAAVDRLDEPAEAAPPTDREAEERFWSHTWQSDVDGMPTREPRSILDDSKPFDQLPLVRGKVCSVCGGEVRHSCSGTVCARGHGGAPLVDKEGGK